MYTRPTSLNLWGIDCYKSQLSPAPVYVELFSVNVLMFHSHPYFKTERFIPLTARSIGCCVALNFRLSTEISSPEEIYLAKDHNPFLGQPLSGE